MRTAILNVVGLTRRHLTLREARTGAPALPQIEAWLKNKQVVPIEPVIPAVTCTMQATYLTGRHPSEHGAVANGWYDRTLSEVQFWKQSNHVVTGEKLWERIRRRHPAFTTAKLFWWYNMYSSAEYSITPRPIYQANGGKVFDIYSHPDTIRPRIKSELGEFPFPSFWGPMSGLPSSQWIAESAKWVEEKYWPNLSLIYLPHLDYDLQRYGPGTAQELRALREIDEVVGGLLTFLRNRAIKPVLLSEYGITEVSRPVHLNRIFREKGWITIRDELGLEILDAGASRVFAVADHQVAHIYIQDQSLLPEVRAVLEATPGVETVIDRVMKHAHGLDHHRAGDLIVVSDDRSWFTYYYWLDDAVAPDFARCIDIHRKPGYDPVELFFDPLIKRPKAAAAWRLIKKKLGFRTLFDLISLDASLVKGSHGRVPASREDWPLLAGDFPTLAPLPSLPATHVNEALYQLIVAGIDQGGSAAS
jgi:predicted AlkP superfamily pyrophosphatase or phosphodiesterase